MKSKIIIFLFMSILCPHAPAADHPIKTYAKKYENIRFLLKAPDQIFQSYEIGSWSPTITYTYTAIDPGAADDLLGTQILRPDQFTVRKIEYSKKKNRIEVEMERDATWKLKVFFENADTLSTDQFDRMFYRLFFRPEESAEDYIRLNSLKLAERFLNTEPALSQLRAQDKIKLISMIAVVGNDSIPSFTQTSQGPFIRVQLPKDLSNRKLNATKKIIANAIETQLERLKQPAVFFPEIPAVAGIHYHWKFSYMDAGDIGIPGFGPNKSADFELLATRNSILQLASGDLTPHDFATRSVLILNGQLISFTSWESSWNKE